MVLDYIGIKYLNFFDEKFFKPYLCQLIFCNKWPVSVHLLFAWRGMV